MDRAAIPEDPTHVEIVIRPVSFWRADPERQAAMIVDLLRTERVQRLDIDAQTGTVKVYAMCHPLLELRDLEARVRRILGD